MVDPIEIRRIRVKLPPFVPERSRALPRPFSRSRKEDLGSGSAANRTEKGGKVRWGAAFRVCALVPSFRSVYIYIASLLWLLWPLCASSVLRPPSSVLRPEEMLGEGKALLRITARRIKGRRSSSTPVPTATDTAQPSQLGILFSYPPRLHTLSIRSRSMSGRILPVGLICD